MQITIADQTYEVQYVETMEPIWTALSAEPKLPKWVMCDVETDGLHPKKARPFLGAFGWRGKVFVFPTTKANVEKIPFLANHVGMLYNHHINFDLHMLANMAEDEGYAFRFKRYGDTMGLCRLTFEALSKGDGGDSLKLKDIGKKYVDPQANRYEKLVKAWLKKKVAMDRKILIAMLKPLKWGIKRLEDAMNKGTEEIPDDVMNTFKEWRNEYPEPNYQDVPMEIMLPYVAVDIIIVDILVEKALPVVESKQQIHILEQEFDCLPVIYDMERQGIEVDRDYLMEANEKMENLIYDLTLRMHDLAGMEFTVGQHSVVKDIYEEKLGYRPESSDKAFLMKQKDAGDELAGIISRLRRLEKWKETYIERILQISEYDGRFYTSMNPFIPVTGRFSGNAQQFPKDPIDDEDGVEIYNPRRAFKMRGYYLDFSQVELRVQAHYTLYYGGDTNLCRAYMPFNCVHAETGEYYDYTTLEGRSRWNEMKPGAPIDTVHWEDLLKEGWSVWIVPETKEPWVPTDVHSATTWKALRIMGYVPEEMSAADLKWWRSKGKTFNFMRNYGGGDKKAAETLDITLEQAKAMNHGYTDSFPVVVSYQKGAERTMHKQGYVVNMSGRRYYINDSWRFYKVANYLIQGSCADDLKKKMVKIWNFIRENGLKMRMVLCVHDELQFEVSDPSEEWAIWKIKEIMEDTPEILVPIVADVEFTDTYWSNKKVVLL
jgi:DNA polymerase-1